MGMVKAYTLLFFLILYNYVDAENVTFRYICIEHVRETSPGSLLKPISVCHGTRLYNNDDYDRSLQCTCRAYFVA